MLRTNDEPSKNEATMRTKCLVLKGHALKNHKRRQFVTLKLSETNQTPADKFRPLTSWIQDSRFFGRCRFQLRDRHEVRHEERAHLANRPQSCVGLAVEPSPLAVLLFAYKDTYATI